MGRDLDNDGNVLEERAAAATGWNTKAIHIALAGGHGSSENDDFFDNFNSFQEDTLLNVIEEIQNIAGRPMEVMGHNQVAAKACPGFNAPKWYTAAKARAKARLVNTAAAVKPDPVPVFDAPSTAIPPRPAAEGFLRDMRDQFNAYLGE
ncbi:MAG: hypothetical protein ACSHW1_17915 [Yoonia sp.]|uniref:hypothetical protein n=1 Tax=Yoonia sp. TaxID=2212373 RepID=UPI003EF468A9